MPADPEPPGLPGDWWTNEQVRTYLAAYGVHIARSTWSTWVARKHAPRPDPEGKIGNYPRWRPAVVRAWWRNAHPELFTDADPPA